MKIEKTDAREVLDSRGRPTIEVELVAGDILAVASVPSGKSTGSNEALEKRDADGRGVSDVLALLHSEVFPQITLRDFADQRAVDDFLIELDGTRNKSRLGANGILAVSIAFAKLSAKAAGVPLWKYVSESENFKPAYPRLYMNMMNGGAHADFRLPFQEYLVVMDGSPAQAYERAKKIFTALGGVIRAEVGEVPMGDEGGYSPKFTALDRPFEILTELIKEDKTFFLGIDAAATEFFHDGAYDVLDKKYSTDGLLKIYLSLANTFPFKSIEDPFAENDPGAFAKLLKESPIGTLVVGDDLTVTNPRILKEMIAIKAANSLIIKPNQIGTLSEVYDTVRLAHSSGWKTIVSHRSGETEDPFIADLAVGVGAYGLKAGAPSQRVRAVKYERLVDIEKER